MTHRSAAGLQGAYRIPARQLPPPQTLAQKQGLRYERHVVAELRRLMPGQVSKLEHNPWFGFTDRYGTGECCPDILLWVPEGVVIVEVKLTYVPDALPKLFDLYCPVVSIALDELVHPLLICRNVTPDSPQPVMSLKKALDGDDNVLQWLGHGHIQW
ncbi:MAG: hypothetical protein ACRD6W_07810 [Nitrososphaerales archaeon]